MQMKKEDFYPQQSEKLIKNKIQKITPLKQKNSITMYYLFYPQQNQYCIIFIDSLN